LVQSICAQIPTIRPSCSATLKASLTDPASTSFAPTIFTTWDAAHLNPFLAKYVIAIYARWATPLVRNPVDVVFLTHLLLSTCTSIPSALLLYKHFTWGMGPLEELADYIGLEYNMK
jgi:hypothetical protein